MPLQILSLKLDGITAGDYLTWCRDPEPPALGFALRSVSVDADPLGDTITAILGWNGPVPRRRRPPQPPGYHCHRASRSTLARRADFHRRAPVT